MNLKCTHCKEPTIAAKWLWRTTFLPFIFLFLQIKCGRCKEEQHYSLNLPWLVTFILDFVLQIGLIFAGIYALVFTNGNPWLMALMFFCLYLLFCYIKVQILLRKYAG